MIPCNTYQQSTTLTHNPLQQILNENVTLMWKTTLPCEFLTTWSSLHSFQLERQCLQIVTGQCNAVKLLNPQRQWEWHRVYLPHLQITSIRTPTKTHIHYTVIDNVVVFQILWSDTAMTLSVWSMIHHKSKNVHLGERWVCGFACVCRIVWTLQEGLFRSFVVS